MNTFAALRSKGVTRMSVITIILRFIKPPSVTMPYSNIKVYQQ
jgi:hypothetical protein